MFSREHTSCPVQPLQERFEAGKKRGLDLELLNSVVTQLASGDTLDAKYRDHDSGGNYTTFTDEASRSTS